MLKSENKKIIQRILLAVIFGIGLFFTAAMNQRSNVQASKGSSLALINLIPADTRLLCKMTGTWVESNDEFKFEAIYLAKKDSDILAGRYTNPGFADADINGDVKTGVWRINMTYTDSGHRGMIKKLVGNGRADRLKNEQIIEGNYKTFLGTNDIKMDGTFKIVAKCK
ncbi:MAG TPA: hypothetical protein PKY82_18670 [Pyrinomonadaceae bacterium]|nr:hypothetical protein [Pyrinomonadaceae bacterium]